MTWADHEEMAYYRIAKWIELCRKHGVLGPYEKALAEFNSGYGIDKND